MKCPNPRCGGKVEEHVNGRGGGSRYCLDGCGFYCEFPEGTRAAPPKPKLDPTPPRPRNRVRRE